MDRRWHPRIEAFLASRDRVDRGCSKCTLGLHCPDYFRESLHQLARLLHLLSFDAQVNPCDVRPGEECDGPVEDDAQSPVPARH